MNETVTVVTSKTNEIGQKTWGIMKGVMAMASQKIEEYTKEGINWKEDDWQQSGAERHGHYQEYSRQSGNESNPSVDNSNRKHSAGGSWDDWDEKEKAKPSNKSTPSSDSWAGWDDVKDEDGYESYNHISSNEGVNQNGKSSSAWTEGGFR